MAQEGPSIIASFSRLEEIMMYSLSNWLRSSHGPDADPLGSCVLYIYPCVCGDDYSSSCVLIAFLFSQMNVNGSFFDKHKFILLEVLVRWKFVSGSHVLRSHDKLLRTIVFGADLQDEVAWGRLPPNPPLTLIFLQQERFCRGLECGCGT